MLQEMQQLAARASGDAAAQASARRALGDFFNASAGMNASASNASNYVQVLEQVTTLHAKLKAGAEGNSERNVAAARLRGAVRGSQGRIRQTLSSLTALKKHSRVARKTVREWTVVRASSAMALVEMDKIWWHIRGVVD